MNCIAYLRVSTDRQDALNQRKDVEGLISSSERVEWVVEHGSAWKDDNLKSRPEFERIVGLVKKGVVKKLYIWDLDRLYRKRTKTVGFLRLCKARGCVVISFRQKYLSEVENAPEPWNEIIYDLIIQVLANIAEEESQKKSDRIRAARERWTRKPGKKDWGRPSVDFNQRRAYHLLFEESGRSLQSVADEVGVSKATIFRFKKVCEKTPPSFIKE